MIRKIWKWVFGERQGQVQVLVLPFGELGGRGMSEGERARAVQAGRDGPAFRAAVQVVQDYYLNAQAMGHWDQRIVDGTAAPYAMAESYLMDVLADLSDMAEGRVPERAGRKDVVRSVKEGGGETRRWGDTEGRGRIDRR